jgi:hypothetical protein
LGSPSEATRAKSICGRRLLTLGPENEPLWVRLFVQRIGEVWAAMIPGNDVPSPGPGELKGLAFFAATREEAEREALVYVGLSERVN